MRETDLIQSSWREGEWPHSAQDAAATARGRGLETLGIGKARLVVRASAEMVCKLAWRESGLVDNLIEARLWERAGLTRQWLAPTLSVSAAGVTDQSLCLPVTWDPLERGGPQWQIVRELAERGISDTAVNLGILGGRIVCYDYCAVSAQLAVELLREDELDHWEQLRGL